MQLLTPSELLKLLKYPIFHYLWEIILSRFSLYLTINGIAH